MIGAIARDSALDFAKGALIAVMIGYHWMNFTWGPIGSINDYFRFLTPAFIFLTGWTIGAYYPKKYGADNPLLYRRLTIRGLQLLGFFISVNLVTHAVLDWRGNPFRSQRGTLQSDVFGIFITGNSELMSFHVLWPISVLLLLAGEGLRLASPRRRAVLWLIAGALLFHQFLPVLSSRNAYLLSFGFLGQAAAGLHRSWSASQSRTALVLLVAFAIYLAAVWHWGARYAVQLLATPLHVALLYSLGQALIGRSGVAAILVWAGRSALTGYVVHVAALQILVQLFRPKHVEPAVAGLILLVATSATTLGIYGVNLFQQLSKRRAASALT